MCMASGGYKQEMGIQTLMLLSGEGFVIHFVLLPMILDANLLCSIELVLISAI